MNEDRDLPEVEAKVRLYHDEGERSDLLGFADLAIAGAFVIKGIRIIMSKPREDKPGGLFISFPSRKGSGAAQEKYFEIAHPITAQARQVVKEIILKAYEEESNKANAQAKLEVSS